ncbi:MULTISPECIES: EfeM/EfeO family lipoprotein [unclassified Streptomyces]|uniref:EfeM/EfeO family lipoprotein n=1 Tax=unclassified Streptomyces TaxID=2593676 RepID=UPI002DD9B767|nr:EfeM/EfeO family lipoprotein [Streptomyces sp. NBC_01766]WSC22439.1 EfeM/EfeO family lipoprotein [Streptomyces sp. NBC_01766]WSV56282.1 EfeM/EfeO family lipoprotein [Streptomyces sp. NBC_01014]
MPSRRTGSDSRTDPGVGTGPVRSTGSDSVETPAVHRRIWAAVAVLATVTAVTLGAFLAADTPAAGRAANSSGSATPDGLRHTSVEVSLGACGHGWTRPRPGTQVFDLRNTSTGPAEVDLVDPRTGAVHAEVEGLAPGTAREMRVTLGGGSYAFRCLPDDADAVTGPTVRIPGNARGGPHVVPVTEHDLIPPTLTYQKWIGERTIELARKTDVLKKAVDSGDLAAARKAWLPAHLVYERMGAAYGTFGDADAAVNGTDAGLPEGPHDPDFQGFHRVEYGLWHGESAASLRGPTDRLAHAVHALRDNWPQQRMDPADLGLRAHEVLENTIRFELTGRTDFGSGSNLATVRANLDGTRELLSVLRPLLTTRDPDLARTDAWLDRTERTVEGFGHDGRWTPLDRLATADRERLNGDVSEATELLSSAAAICDLRRTA